MISIRHVTVDIGGQYSGGFADGKKEGEGSNHVMRPDSQWELYKVTHSILSHT